MIHAGDQFLGLACVEPGYFLGEHSLQEAHSHLKCDSLPHYHPKRLHEVSQDEDGRPHAERYKSLVLYSGDHAVAVLGERRGITRHVSHKDGDRRKSDASAHCG